MFILSKELRLYFIRHGETQYNIEKRMQGFCDSPLTVNGIKQAMSVGAGLRDIDFICAYASESQRVLDTAKYAIGDRDISITKDARLKEMNFGVLEAMLPEEIVAKHGNILETFFSLKDLERRLDEGESYSDLLIRTKAAVKDIIDAHQETGGNVLVFSHGVTIAFYIRSLLNRTDFPQHDNCCVSVIKVSDGEITVENVADATFRDAGMRLLDLEDNA